MYITTKGWSTFEVLFLLSAVYISVVCGKPHQATTETVYDVIENNSQHAEHNSKINTQNTRHHATSNHTCNEIYQSSRSGNIYSPGWPDPYPTNYPCQYSIFSPIYPSPSLITLKFLVFDLAGPCQLDYLSVYSVHTSDVSGTKRTLIGHFCQYEEPPTSMTVAGDGMFLDFVSSNANENKLYQGFHATFSISEDNSGSWMFNYWVIILMIMITAAIGSWCYKSIKKSRYKRHHGSRLDNDGASSIGGDTSSVGCPDDRYRVSYNPGDITSPVRLPSFDYPPPYTLPDSTSTIAPPTTTMSTEQIAFDNHAYLANEDDSGGTASQPPSYEEATKNSNGIQ